MGQELPPVAVCTTCGAYTSDGRRIDGLCSGMPGRGPCGGMFGSAIGKTDWEKCRYCKGTGSEGRVQCPSCQGTGWEYIRARWI